MHQLFLWVRHFFLEDCSQFIFRKEIKKVSSPPQHMQNKTDVNLLLLLTPSFAWNKDLGIKILYVTFFNFCTYLLTGTKMDLREDKETLALLSDQGQSPVKREAGQKLANKIRAVKYMECSALTQRGLKQVK